MRDYPRIARRITFTLFLTQGAVLAGLIGISTVNAIVGKELSGKLAWAGIPTAVYLLAAALAAFGWGFFTERFGRRSSLLSGLSLGILGAALAGGAIIQGSFWMFLTGLAVVGVSRASLILGRYAAAEVNPPEVRGRAIANVVLGSTIGAVLGPLLVSPSAQLALGLGLNELAGVFGVGMVVFVLGTAIVFIGLRPDPTLIGRELAHQIPAAGTEAQAIRPLRILLRHPIVVFAMLSMMVGEFVMVMLMVITSLLMIDNGQSLGTISFIMSSHTIGMFGFSVISGRVADRWGRGAVIGIGAVTLILANLGATLSTEAAALAVAMFLLGLGWNFCYVGGSTLLADQLTLAEQARTQGFTDLLIGLSAATGSISSGFVFARWGYGTMGFVGAALALIPLGLTLWQRRGSKRLADPVGK